MAKAFVVVHGSYRNDTAAGSAGVPVPAGKRISCYADADTTLTLAAALAALNAGITRSKTYHPGDLLPNYEFRALEDEWVAAVAASVSSLTGGRLYLIAAGPSNDCPVHAPGSFCSRLARFADESSAAGWAAHVDTCADLLSRLPEDDIHLLACRVERGRSGATGITGGVDHDRDYSATILQRALEILSHAASGDRYGALRYFEALPQASRASLRSVPLLVAWLDQMHEPLADLKGRRATALWQVIETSGPYGPMIWKAMPDGTRRTLMGSSVVTDWLRQAGVSGPLFTAPEEAAPETLAQCWADRGWRERFWRWMDHRFGGHAEHLLHLSGWLQSQQFQWATLPAQLADILPRLENWARKPAVVAQAAEVLTGLLEQVHGPATPSDFMRLPADRQDRYLLRYREEHPAPADDRCFAELDADEQAAVTAWVVDYAEVAGQLTAHEQQELVAVAQGVHHGLSTFAASRLQEYFEQFRADGGAKGKGHRTG